MTERVLPRTVTPSPAALAQLAAAKAKPPRWVYGYVCLGCFHPASDHRQTVGVDAPYRCEHCPCTITQQSPMVGLSRQRWNRWCDLIGQPR